MSQWALSPDKGKRLMLVPQTTDGFRTRVSALQSLDGSKGVSFHTFSLPEDRCVHMLVKNLGRQMPEGIIREEMETLGICNQGILQLHSRRSDQEASNVHSLTPHFIVSVVRGPEVMKVHSLTELCSLRVLLETYITPQGPLQCKCCQHFSHMQWYCGYAPQYVASGKTHLSGESSTSQQQR